MIKYLKVSQFHNKDTDPSHTHLNSTVVSRGFEQMGKFILATQQDWESSHKAAPQGQLL